MRLLMLLTLGWLGAGSALARSEFDVDLRKFHRVLILGDSITYSGQAWNDVETVLRTQPIPYDLELLNLGLPSETVSGLSEADHPCTGILF